MARAFPGESISQPRTSVSDILFSRERRGFGFHIRLHFCNRSCPGRRSSIHGIPARHIVCRRVYGDPRGLASAWPLSDSDDLRDGNHVRDSHACRRSNRQNPETGISGRMSSAASGFFPRSGTAAFTNRGTRAFLLAPTFLGGEWAFPGQLTRRMQPRDAGRLPVTNP